MNPIDHIQFIIYILKCISYYFEFVFRRFTNAIPIRITVEKFRYYLNTNINYTVNKSIHRNVITQMHNYKFRNYQLLIIYVKRYICKIIIS